jgi:hypothetical protein
LGRTEEVDPASEAAIARGRKYGQAENLGGR